MKLLLLLSLALVTNGFSPSTTARTKTSTSVQAASGLDGGRPRLLAVSTEPVATRNVSQRERNAMKDVVIDPDYSLTWQIAALCPLIIWYHPSYYDDGSLSLVGVCGGIFHLLFASLLWVQTRRVRCVFEKDSFEFYNLKGPKLDKLVQKPDNYVVGTVNRWKYDTITNYGFFPSLDYPVIVYFKETETPKEKWNKWFAAFDSYGRGQPHFFPGICNARQFKQQMEERGVKAKRVPTLKDRSQYR